MNIEKTISLLERDLQSKRNGEDLPYSFAEYIVALGALKGRSDTVDIYAVICEDIHKIVLDYQQD